MQIALHLLARNHAEAVIAQTRRDGGLAGVNAVIDTNLCRVHLPQQADMGDLIF
ncbi:hypothetical protein EDP2_3964 [Enterobacter cloacae S611]|uniref:Uncharacterized protein n=1 Tax=Enterobacter cloacae S611 TaxID=1399146 RepID=A0ABP2ZS21_ENTCL|nr:hypothetical protein EDP2_3964 [Enterobacter cloacae S611]